MFDVKITDIERTYEPHAFVQFAWIENWFRAQISTLDMTDSGLETGHFKTGAAKGGSIPTVPDVVLAKSAAMFEAKLSRKKVVSVPSVPRKPSVEATKPAPGIKQKDLQKDKPPVLVLHSNQFQPWS